MPGRDSPKPGDPAYEAARRYVRGRHRALPYEEDVADRRVGPTARPVGGNAEAVQLAVRLDVDDATGAGQLSLWLLDRDGGRARVDRSAFARQHAFVRAGAESGRRSLRREVSAAARLCAPLRWAARSADGTAPLDVGEVAEFVFADEAHLTGAGFVVELPPELEQARRTPLRMRVVPDEPAGPSWGLGEAILRFRWEATVGDVVLSDAERAELAASAGRALARVGDRWIAVRDVDRDRIGVLSDPAGVMDLGAAAAGALDAGVGAAAAAVTPADIAELVRAVAAAGEVADMAEPDGFVGELRPYQRRGLAWLAHMTRLGLGACLADDMGLGKTPQVIALMLGVAASAPSLVVAPASVLHNWERELARFAPSLVVHRHHGSGRHRRQWDTSDGRLVVVTTYATMRRDAERLRHLPWGRVIFDEAQNIKNPQAAASHAARSIAVPAPVRVALTGTPLENRVLDLWSIMGALNPGMLGTRGAFTSLFGAADAGDARSAERLHHLVAPFILRRVKTDPAIAADLPTKTVAEVACGLTAEQATLYQAVVDEYLPQVRDATRMQRRALILKTITLLKQVCDHPALVDHGRPSPTAGRSGKLERLTEQLEEVFAERDAALVFTQYVQAGRIISRHIGENLELPAPLFHGGLSLAARQRMIDEFQQGTGPGVLVVSLKAGGAGLNLTRATNVFHYDRWWNPAVENQATDRAHRIGQTRPVFVWAYRTAGTIEDKIVEVLHRKRDLADRVVGAGEAALTELAFEDLAELVALDRDAALIT